MATKLTLLLFFEYSSKKVFFAEARKEVVDFLFGLLTLPLGSVIELLSDADFRMSGSLTSLFESLNELDVSSFLSNQTKSFVRLAMKPHSALPSGALLPPAALPADKKLIRCSNSACNFSSKFFAELCGPLFLHSFAGVNQGKSIPVAADRTLEKAEGAVAPDFSRINPLYCVTDDLRVFPACGSEYENLRRSRNLKLKTVILDQEEALQLLLVSFQSKTVLTDVFAKLYSSE